MDHRPFADQIQSPAWQLAFEDLEGADFNRGFEFAVSGVKMWWRVIIEKHTDQDPVEVLILGIPRDRFYHPSDYPPPVGLSTRNRALWHLAVSRTLPRFGSCRPRTKWGLQLKLGFRESAPWLDSNRRECIGQGDMQGQVRTFTT